MRRVSKRRAKLMRKAGPWRDQYLSEHLACAYLGCLKLAVDVHEIARGSARRASLMEPAALLTLCRAHHDEVQDWPVARQLALKACVSPHELDIARVNELRGRAPGAITEADVVAEMRNL